MRTEIAAAMMANISPKVIRLRPGSKRLATNPRMLSVAKPKTAPHNRSYILLPDKATCAITANRCIWAPRNLRPRTPRYTETMTIKAVFFDVGNTLLFLNHTAVLTPLHENGSFPAPDLLLEIEHLTKREFDSLQRDGSTVDHGFWQIYYSHLLNKLGVSDEVLCAKLVSLTRMSANWCRVRPYTREALLRLAKNYRIGVISNADGKIAEVLERCGIADCFESITDSGIVGKEKPHPAIFEAAVRSLGVSAAESLYTGDVYSVDYLGATNYGMRCVLFDVSGAYRDAGFARVESLEQLELHLRNA
jgi:HAD superfamily hydrolase (TIGR01509 family)